MSRKKVGAGEAKAPEINPDATYAVEVLKPIVMKGFSILPRHTNVKLSGRAVMQHASKVKVLREVVKPAKEG